MLMMQRLLLFQSTLPRGERRPHGAIRGSDGHFNPRSREGSDQFDAWSNFLTLFISIHAPARGATQNLDLFLRKLSISIHAPARGATRPYMINLFLTQYFNPRSREGSDTKKMESSCGMWISIHAPARGATRPCFTISFL